MTIHGENFILKITTVCSNCGPLGSFQVKMLCKTVKIKFSTCTKLQHSTIITLDEISIKYDLYIDSVMVYDM